ncbi:3997_t:CDS:2, partial [Dentiscutata erythropus]
IDSKNVIYIFGGRVELDMGASVFTIFDDFFTFDTNTLLWTNLSYTNHPSKRSHCTATLMPDGTIIYIGGVTQTNPGENLTRTLMTDINIFDTIQSSWSFKTANSPSSVNIDPRVGHTTVLGNITNDYGPSTNASADMYLMDLSNYTWVTQFGKTTPTPTPNSTNNTHLIIIIGIGLIAWRFKWRMISKTAAMYELADTRVLISRIIIQANSEHSI